MPNVKNCAIIMVMLIGIIATNTYSRISMIRINNTRNSSMNYLIKYHTYKVASVPAIVFGTPQEKVPGSITEEIPANYMKDVPIPTNYQIDFVTVSSPRGTGPATPRHIDLSGERVANIKDQEPYMLEITITEIPQTRVFGLGLGKTFDVDSRIVYLGNKP